MVEGGAGGGVRQGRRSQARKGALGTTTAWSRKGGVGGGACAVEEGRH